jgi:hypothetical protein
VPSKEVFSKLSISQRVTFITSITYGPGECSPTASIYYAVTGVDVVISTVPIAALNVQGRIAAAAKEVYFKLVPSEFRNIPEGATDPGFIEEPYGSIRRSGVNHTSVIPGPLAMAESNFTHGNQGSFVLVQTHHLF